MAPKRGPQATTTVRVAALAGILASGGTRGDCLRFAAEEWGVAERSADRYIAMARDGIRQEWAQLQRPQAIAELLSQLSTLQMKARATGNLAVALGCISTAAKLCKLF